MNGKVVEESIVIDAPSERVWQAVTDPDQLAQWFLPPMLGAQMKRDKSGTIFVCMGPMEVPVAVFEAVKPPQRVTIRGLPDKLIAATYMLEEEPDGTRVTVTMTGFESLSEDGFQASMRPSSASWKKALANLKAYVDGVALPFPEGYVAALFGYRREAKEKYAVERSIWIDASRERVWRAITDPEQIQQWFSPGTPWRLSALQIGGRLSPYDPETNSDITTEIIEAMEPPHRLVTRTVPTPEEAAHVSTWTLVEENGGTRLTITHAGYELVPDDTRHPKMEQNTFGFGMLLENLKAYVEEASLPYPGGF